MHALIHLTETAELMASAPGVCALLEDAADVVTVDAQTSALIASGLRVQQLLDRVADDIELAQSIEIDSPELLAEAQEIAGRLAAVASDSGEIERERKMLTSPLNAVIKLINAGYQAPRAHLSTALGNLKAKILRYDQEQRRLAAERERQAEEARRKEAERIAAEEAEARAKAQELLQAGQEAQALGGEVAAQELLQEASATIDRARTDAATAIAALHTAPPVAPAVKAKGVRGKWTAVVSNKENLIVHIARRIEAGDTSLVGLLDVNESACNRLASVQENGLNIPGLRAQFTESVSVRRAPVV